MQGKRTVVGSIGHIDNKHVSLTAAITKLLADREDEIVVKIERVDHTPDDIDLREYIPLSRPANRRTAKHTPKDQYSKGRRP